MSELQYATLRSMEIVSKFGAYGVRIQVAAPSLDLESEPEVMSAVYKATDLVQSEVQASIIAHHEDTPFEIEDNKELVKIFDTPIFVEEIPNEYCSASCCRHLPWFIITTKVGRFKIGQRKRVINIDWSDTVNTKTATELFPEEDVTKGERYIHAWGIKDAKKYVNRILENIKEVDYA